MVRMCLLSCVLVAACCTYDVKVQETPKVKNNIEIAQFDLIDHITNRTVKIPMQCKVVGTSDSLLRKGYEEFGWGTGTIIKSTPGRSYVLTAAHVVQHENEVNTEVTVVCDKLEIIVGYGKNAKHESASLLYLNKAADLVILLVKKDLKYSSHYGKYNKVGQQIHNVSYPVLRGNYGSVLTYSKGYTSIVNIPEENKLMKLPNLMRFSLFGYFGSSGSAVWDDAGKIVGVVNTQGGFRISGEVIPQGDSLYGVGAEVVKSAFDLLENH
jgi:S1-C subfamily serine protease